MWLILVLSLACYRISRFVIEDRLFDGPRAKIQGWLVERKWGLWHKFSYMFGCPYCLTIWVSAALVAATLPFEDVPLPMWTWLGVATGSLIAWVIIEGRDG
jgi:hypothetical protein